MPGIGQPECKPDQDKGERMLAVLTEMIGLRPEPGRAERRKRDGCGEQPGEYSQEDCHREGISRFTDRIMPLTPTWYAGVVNGADGNLQRLAHPETEHETLPDLHGIAA